MKSCSSETRRARPLLGTIVEIGAHGPYASTGIDAAFHEIEIVHRLMSFHEATSDLSRINRASPGEIVPINHRTYEVLSCAQLISRVSSGAFDVTIGRKLVEEGFLPQPLGTESIPDEASFEDLNLLPENSVTLRRRAWIDLGGIAKGYAVDRAVMSLKASAVASGIVNAGGDLFVFGDPQLVHIRHPENPSRMFALGNILNSAVASSSGCFSAHDDRAANDPLVEPRQTRCVDRRSGVTIIAPRCIVADALTKVLRLAPHCQRKYCIISTRRH